MNKNKQSKELILILVTNGGNSDATYKIGRYLQDEYSEFKILIPGSCKSAGTLLAIAANEIIFGPYGELVPLDVQRPKTDSVIPGSGLNISEAFFVLENRERMTFTNLTMEIIEGSNGSISFQTASHIATKMVSVLYGPIFSQVDHDELGSIDRAMRIGGDYGKRLDVHYGNLKEGALEFIVEKYPSHSFVIDMREAKELFNRVRKATDDERQIITNLGKDGIIPKSDEPDLHNLTKKNTTTVRGNEHDTRKGKDAPKQSTKSKTTENKSNGKNHTRASKT